MPLQMVWCHYRRKTAALETAPAIACLRALAGCTHDPVNAIDPALLAQIIRYVPVAVHCSAFQPGLLDVYKQAPIFLGPIAFWLGTKRRNHWDAPPSSCKAFGSNTPREHRE